MDLPERLSVNHKTELLKLEKARGFYGPRADCQTRCRSCNHVNAALHARQVVAVAANVNDDGAFAATIIAELIARGRRSLKDVEAAGERRRAFK
jgi:hypothetical protein